MYKLDSSGSRHYNANASGNKNISAEAANLEIDDTCLSHILTTGYTKDLKDKGTRTRLDLWNFLKGILSTELDRTVHIIFITASEAYYEKLRGQHFPELGKINYIQKPVGNDELVQLVDVIIANSITMD